ncbi:CRTAC1 family protein [Bremerella cremea]|uniref:CRTAC1 family protein n=1 Tax=Bremerella cremea TaxID=1031537 RepID=A0A368KUR9_9BACT|nr:CRTAC1 family protein [Bremerella cremea]RCS54056.1 CRTAC1 family protein [Bremerella cremea]
MRRTKHVWAIAILTVVSGCEQKAEPPMSVGGPAVPLPSADQQLARLDQDVGLQNQWNTPVIPEKEDAPDRDRVPFIATNNKVQNVEHGIQLTDVTESTGITFVHNDGGSGQGYIVEASTGGVALFDYDLDGFIDIYFLNGGALKGTNLETPPKNALYRNNGDWTFTDVTETAGVGDTGHGMGVAAADYDNDGDEDLYINNFGPNVFYRNNGDGTFTNVTQETGTGNADRFGAGVCFFDMDRDGDLDLYVGNYVDFTYENHVPIEIEGHFFQAGPQYYQAVADTLYRNNGDGTFSDVTEESGIATARGPSMAIMATDYDEDGDLDVFVCNDNTPNYLWQNDGTGKFKEVAILTGVAYDFDGKKNASMGVDCGDYDNDGHIDIFLTDWQSEMPVLYRNLGNGLFEDATSTAQITNELFPHVHWGTGLVDFDNDGDLDLFVACGHFDEIERIDDRTAKRVRNYLLMNNGDGTFTDISETAGNGLAVVESSRGAAFDDLDNDGDVDAVILNSTTSPTILRNDSKRSNTSIQIQLHDTLGNHFGVGSRVSVVSGDLKQVAEIYSGRSFQGDHGRRLTFGLGTREKIDQIEVRWPDGKKEVFQQKLDRENKKITLERGKG